MRGHKVKEGFPAREILNDLSAKCPVLPRFEWLPCPEPFTHAGKETILSPEGAYQQ
jgi:hypothetical protein